MIKVVLAVVAVAVAWLWLAQLRKLPPHQQRKHVLKYGGWALLAVLIFMVLTGRAHWLVALLGAMVPLARFMLGFGLQLFSLWRQRRPSAQQTSTPAPSSMSVAEAMATLGLNETLGRTDQLDRATVINAHRRLIQKLHPDRGGNDYLAAKINEAKAVLLKTLE